MCPGGDIMHNMGNSINKFANVTGGFSTAGFMASAFTSPFDKASC